MTTAAGEPQLASTPAFTSATLDDMRREASVRAQAREEQRQAEEQRRSMYRSEVGRRSSGELRGRAHLPRRRDPGQQHSTRHHDSEEQSSHSAKDPAQSNQYHDMLAGHLRRLRLLQAQCYGGEPPALEIMRKEIFSTFQSAMGAMKGGALVIALNAKVEVSVMVSGTFLETRRLLTAVALSVEAELMAVRCGG